MNPKTIDRVCSRSVHVFHWRNVGSKDRINEVPHVSTRLADLGETISKQLVSWGYAVCDRRVRQYYKYAAIARRPSSTELNNSWRCVRELGLRP
jgi:hypothetical protein